MGAAHGGCEPSVANIKKNLNSVGVDVDGGKLDLVVNELPGKNIEELVAEGKEAVGIICVAGASSIGGVASVAEAKKEEIKVEVNGSCDKDNSDHEAVVQSKSDSARYSFVQDMAHR